jgi:hypothetical protein
VASSAVGRGRVHHLGGSVLLADLLGNLLGDVNAVLHWNVLTDLNGNLDGDLPGDLVALLLGVVLALGVKDGLVALPALDPGHLGAEGNLDVLGDLDGDLLALLVPDLSAHRSMSVGLLGTVLVGSLGITFVVSRRGVGVLLPADL